MSVAWEAPNPSGMRRITDGDRLWDLAETMPSMITTLNRAARVGMNIVLG